MNQPKSEPIRVVAIIQARMQSTRLPGKSMKELAGKPIIGHVIERALAMRPDISVVVATCNDNEPLVEYSRSMRAFTFIGSEHNVLERYTLAAREFDADYIVRITGDNPFTDAEYGSYAIEKAIEESADLSSVSGIPLGTGVELIKRDALERAYRESSTDYHREHVTPYIKEHPDYFMILRYAAEFHNPFSDLRLTVDTDEDFRLVSIIMQDLYKGKPFPISEVIDLLSTHPEYVTINSAVKQRPMTHSEKVSK